MTRLNFLHKTVGDGFPVPAVLAGVRICFGRIRNRQVSGRETRPLQCGRPDGSRGVEGAAPYKGMV